MFKCERCGAELLLDSDRCSDCGTVSGSAVSLPIAAPTPAQAAIARRVAEISAEQEASRALLWGLLSPLCLCVPVPSLLAVMAFQRAQAAARAGGVALLARARVGLALGALSGLGFVALFVYLGLGMQADAARAQARKTALSQIVAQHENAPTLDRELACALAEIALLNKGFGGRIDSAAFRDLKCRGALRVVGERAELDDFELRPSSRSAPVTATICFKHGSRWLVESVGVTSCELDH